MSRVLKLRRESGTGDVWLEILLDKHTVEDGKKASLNLTSNIKSAGPIVNDVVREFLDEQEREKSKAIDLGDMRPPAVQALAAMRDEKEVSAERSVDYGDHVEGARQLGRIFGAMLTQRLGIAIPDLDPDLVHLMMAQVKMVRLGFKGGHEDSILDARNYLRLSEEACPRPMTHEEVVQETLERR